MDKAHCIKLKPTKAQDVFFRRSCGVARFSYNWALNKWTELYKSGKNTSAYSLIKLQNSIKKEEFPWMLNIGKCAPQYAIHNLESAFKRMWKWNSGYPKFKKKGKKDSFLAVESSVSFKQYNYKIWIPRLGWVKCCENLRFTGKVSNVTIKRTANAWFAVVSVKIDETPIEMPMECENQTTIGIDLGLKSMMVLSDGTVFENPRALKRNLKSLKRLQRGVTRKQKGSNNRRRQQSKLAEKHYKISCIRKTAIHQATSQIVKNHTRIIIEDLQPQNMVKNQKIAQSISDISFGEIVRQLTYKAKWSGRELIKADMWFPSSKICSKCGNKKHKLLLGDRTYCCENCGLTIDRDINAAMNLANYSPTSKYEESEACGVDSSSLETENRSTEKHELNKLSSNS